MLEHPSGKCGKRSRMLPLLKLTPRIGGKPYETLVPFVVVRLRAIARLSLVVLNSWLYKRKRSEETVKPK
jgi:hypothetical protein